MPETQPASRVTFETRRILVGNDKTVSAVVASPIGVAPAAAIILAHGAGNDMHSDFVCAMHERLAAAGNLCVKFNFLYKEKGGKAPDPAKALLTCYRAVLEDVRRKLPRVGMPIIIGGKSMGGRMASHLAAEGADIAGLLLLGYPLHPAGRPEQLRREHLETINVPMLFVAGTRDSLCQLDLLQETLRVIDKRRPGLAQLHIIEGGDHSFDVLKSLKRSRPEVWDEIAAVAAKWARSLRAET